MSVEHTNGHTSTQNNESKYADFDDDDDVHNNTLFWLCPLFQFNKTITFQ
jgi:hypothetical protein